MMERSDEQSAEIRQLQLDLRAIGKQVDEVLAEGAARCGPYTLLAVLGEGGYGIVYAAVQNEPISRRVAIKVLKRGLDTQEVLRRFALEQHALGRINHAAVTPILDSGVTIDGRPWFAMPLFDGDGITAACSDAALSLMDRLQVFAEVCDGVHAAHIQGIVHRDLKPANILLVRDSSGERTVRIIDFGIAKALEAHPSRTLVTDRPRLGTPAYMAPEQLGGWGDADVRTDVYSLGLVLGELLNGLAPTAREEECASKQHAHHRPLLSRALAAAVLQDVVDAGAIARSRALASPAALLRKLRGDLDAMVSKATMHEPHLRYQSAEAFASDIRRVLAHEPIAARTPSVRYVLSRAVRRNRVVVLIGVIALAAMLSTMIFAWMKAIEASEQSARASLQARRASEVSEIIRSVFGGIDPAMAKGRDPALLAEIVGTTANTLIVELPQRDLVSAAQVAATLAEALIDLQQPKRAIALLEPVEIVLAARLASDDFIRNPQAQIDFLFEEARVRASLGDAWWAHDVLFRGIIQLSNEHLEAHQAWRDALDTLESISALDDPLAMQCAVGLWNARKTWPESRDLAEFESWIAPRILALDDKNVMKWSFLLRRAEIGDFVMILRDYPPLLKGLELALGAEHPRVIEANVRFLSFLVCAAVESCTNPIAGVPEFTDASRHEHWVETASRGESLAQSAHRLLGPTHRITLAAKLWWLQAKGYAEGPIKVRHLFEQLRREVEAATGPNSLTEIQIDGAQNGVENGEKSGKWW